MENVQHHQPWNKGKLIGQKRPLKLKDIWATRIHLQIGKRIRDLALCRALYDWRLPANNRHTLSRAGRSTRTGT